MTSSIQHSRMAGVRKRGGILACLGLWVIVSSAALAAQPAPRIVVWDYSQPGLMPEGWGGLRLAVNETTKTPDGQKTIEVVPDNNRDDQDFLPG